jgi:hypothetical protein
MSDATVDCKFCNGTGNGSGGFTALREIVCPQCKGTGRQPMPLNPWLPMIDSVDVKTLGKLGEECSELATAIFRCLIQGIDEREPVTGKLNRDWLRDEIADTLCNINLVCARFALDDSAIIERVTRKRDHLTAWHAMADTRMSTMLRAEYERGLADRTTAIPVRIISKGDPR